MALRGSWTLTPLATLLPVLPSGWRDRRRRIRLPGNHLASIPQLLLPIHHNRLARIHAAAQNDLRALGQVDLNRPSLRIVVLHVLILSRATCVRSSSGAATSASTARRLALVHARALPVRPPIARLHDVYEGPLPPRLQRSGRNHNRVLPP